MVADALTELLEHPTDVVFEIPAHADGTFLNMLRRVASHQIEVADLIGCAAQLTAAGEMRQAAVLYRAWIESNPSHALLWAVNYNYGVALAETNDLTGSADALRAAIRLKPEFCPPYINLGSLLDRQGLTDHAVTEWTALVTMFPTVTGNSVQHKTMALNQIGRVLQISSRPAEAEEMLRQSLEIDPEQPEVIEHVIALRHAQCKWPSVLASERVTTKRLVGAISPLSLAIHTDDAMFQLARAYRYSRSPIRTPNARDLVHGLGAGPDGQRKLRVGYLSSDLRAHAVGFAMTDVLETHDRDRFEISAYYCGVDWEDDTKTRIRRSVDHWIDINPLDDRSAAARIAADKIDILVDLNGYSKSARTNVFALRPAPIAVNWFGFPGTMGTPYHHYLIADDYIVPPGHEIYYSEKVLRLPCYQPNDRNRVVSSHHPTRQEAGLPESGFVYCCLNGTQKLTPVTFGRWMNILRHVPDSVLWLLNGHDQTLERLRQIAARHHVAPERIIFAGSALNPDHLARYALADLFLDTLPYGAHTTASDALWMGVPILTLSGRSFASRVCGSLVRAAGLPELICTDADEYVAKAISFGQDRRRTTVLKQQLLATRKTSLLFDTSTLTTSLEGLYRQMWDEFAHGERPVPDLKNLDLYHEIGVGLDLEAMELLSGDAYHRLYQQNLADMHILAPIEPDGRFWKS